MKTKKLVQFVVNPTKSNYGSTELRVFQMVRILEKQFGEQIRFRVANLPSQSPYQELWALKQKRGTICVFADVSLSKIQKRTLQILRFRGVRTCIDYVDTDLRRMLKFNADVHIGASHTSLRLMRDIVERAKGSSKEVHGELFLVHHNTDERFSGITMRPRSTVYPLYLGDVGNTIYSEAIADRVEFINLTRSEQVKNILSDLGRYNLHYCIRRPVIKKPGNIIAKPFTKGFIAAQIGAPVLVNEAVDDALDLLGADYPFMVPDNSETSILSGLEKAKECFGGPAWELAIERMDAMKAVFSHEGISVQYKQIFDYLSG